LSPKRIRNHSIFFKREDIFLFKKGCAFMKNGLYKYCEERRIKLGLSKAEFCCFLGISKPTYWRLSESEKVSPHVVGLIADRFLISREKLVRKLKK
jgi:DNA-binding XRE family transcriptional regulator